MLYIIFCVHVVNYLVYIKGIIQFIQYAIHTKYTVCACALFWGFFSILNSNSLILSLIKCNVNYASYGQYQNYLFQWLYFSLRREKEGFMSVTCWPSCIFSYLPFHPMLWTLQWQQSFLLQVDWTGKCWNPLLLLLYLFSSYCALH